MAVMEGIMCLFVKEVVSPERVVSAVRRFADLSPSDVNPPKDPEQALLLWVTKSCAALSKRVASQANVSRRLLNASVGYLLVISLMVFISRHDQVYDSSYGDELIRIRGLTMLIDQGVCLFD